MLAVREEPTTKLSGIDSEKNIIEQDEWADIPVAQIVLRLYPYQDRIRYNHNTDTSVEEGRREHPVYSENLFGIKVVPLRVLFPILLAHDWESLFPEALFHDLCCFPLR